MHAAVETGVGALHVLGPLCLAPPPPFLLGQHVMEALVVAAQDSLEISDRCRVVNNLSLVTSDSLDVLFELLIIYFPQPLLRLSHRSL